MASIFTRIMEGEIPGRLIWRDERAVAMVDIRPLNTGHCLVIPIQEIDQWTDLEPSLASHLMAVAHLVGQAQMAAFAPARVGLMIAGFEVPHTHLHVVPLDSMSHLDFGQADTEPDADGLDEVAARLRAMLRRLGDEVHVTDD